MQDLLKFWPITFQYEGTPMMIPMGEIINVRKDADGNAQIEVKGDSWGSETPFEKVMAQWVRALGNTEHGSHSMREQVILSMEASK